MVDPVLPSNIAKLRLTSGPSERPLREASAAPTSDQPVKATDGVNLSDAASMKLATELTQKGPPLDAEKVNRIKDAVAQGSYPLDFQRLSESIFQDYSAMTR